MFNSPFWQAVGDLPSITLLFLLLALIVAFGFEFINGFHDTANAVTTVIYTNSLKPMTAVLFSGFCNFLGVLLGGTAVAFSIVNLLPVDVLIDESSGKALVMVISLLLAGVIWNLATWSIGLPVSSSHTLIGSILGVGLANSLLTKGNLSGVNWSKSVDVGLSLLISPVIGFALSFMTLLAMKFLIRDEKLFTPPEGHHKPPGWIRRILIATCGAVSFAHGSNDGQKGMGLILLVLIGFMPAYYALDLNNPGKAIDVKAGAEFILQNLPKHHFDQNPRLKTELDQIAAQLANKSNFSEIPENQRWILRQSIFESRQIIQKLNLEPELTSRLSGPLRNFSQALEYVPFWVVIGVALALGIGTTIGYERIVITIAEKIGKSHLTYGQGASAELVAALTIAAADLLHMPVSTTQVLSSGIAGTMVANKSGVQPATLKRIGLAWLLTLPASVSLAAGLFFIGHLIV
ncbi:MAG: inorganic phosphate transporter [Planctomycetota bacterium]|nr:inorganic phosphate transporter [Planctomycetota bacterium]